MEWWQYLIVILGPIIFTIVVSLIGYIISKKIMKETEEIYHKEDKRRK